MTSDAGLTLMLLGGFEARLQDGSTLILPTKKTQALLSCLALSPGRTHARAELAARLWPDMPAPQARANLRQALSRLRQALPRALRSALIVEGASVALDRARVEVDVARFEALVAAGDAPALEEAARLYRGDLLTGLVLGERAFDDWLDTEREWLRDLARHALGGLRPGGQTAPSSTSAVARLSSNLPQPASDLIGREAELAEVAALLGVHRLVTLIGAGGIGKTRLALEVARDALLHFADGVWLAELAPLSDPALVPVTVAVALGLTPHVDVESPERVAAALGRRRLLLVLDNGEHVIEAAARMAVAVLRANPHARVLATSREPLRAPGEHVYRVRSLEVPAEGVEEPAALLDAAAVRLFVARAQAMNLHFSLDARRAALAAAICRRLDGIPLAIELAAARTAALGVDELAAHLDDRFRLLTGGHRTALARQQTLRATLDWSYDLLSPTERTLLQRLAIFVGGFTLEAAGDVATAGELGALDVEDGVATLAAKSLVVVEVAGTRARYRLLETTRAYALEKLRASGELDQVARRHAAYYRHRFAREPRATGKPCPPRTGSPPMAGRSTTCGRPWTGRSGRTATRASGRR